MTTLAQRLQAATLQAQTQAQTNVDNYLNTAGMAAIEGFLTQIANTGANTSILHIEKTFNPRAPDTGFATLSGELAVINAQPAMTIVIKNTIGWMYLNGDPMTPAEFITEVTNLIDNLTTQGLTVTDQIGFDAADINVSW